PHQATAPRGVARVAPGDPHRPGLRPGRSARARRRHRAARVRLVDGTRRRGAREGGRVKYLGIAAIYVWRYTVGVFLPKGQCKYHPSCSQYAIDALREYGLVVGSAKAGWRLLRCNPWSRGGVDYA